MKSLVNQTTKMKAEGGEDATYADLAKLCLQQPAAGGFQVDAIRKRLRVLDVAEAAIAGQATTIEMEDEDAKTLQECVSAMRWGAVNATFVEFSDAVAGMAGGS